MSSSAFRRNLFDTVDHWINNPVGSFNLWLSEQQYKSSTVTVYQTMFSRFCQWLENNGKTIDRCESGDIPLFLDSANANLPATRQKAQTSRQRQQYLRLLERVFTHLSELGLRMDNPAKQASIQGAGRGKDHPTRFLDHEERRRVIQHIETRLIELQANNAGPNDWIEYRDIALIAVLIGAGLKVGNLKYLTLNCINLPEEYIELSQAHYTHRARIFPFAVPPIKAWLSMQYQLFKTKTPENQPVFIADRSKGFGRQAKTQQMHPSSVHRRIQRILMLCEISGDRASAQTLRNTYAGILIDAGATDNELVDFLGIQTGITAQRLRINYASQNSAIKCSGSHLKPAGRAFDAISGSN